MSDSTPYKVVINEHQRKLLMRLVKAGGLCLTDILEKEPGQIHDTNLDEAKELYQMLDDMPEVEEKQPGCWHGFCE